MADSLKGLAVDQVGRRRRAERLLLGSAVTALLAVPLVNFLAPLLGAAAATHLIHRKELSRNAA